MIGRDHAIEIGTARQCKLSPSVGLMWIGVFQLKRNFFSPYSGYGMIERIS